MRTFFEPEQVVWKLSAAWANKNLDCTLSGIINKCHGMCCSSPTFWPPIAGKKEEDRGKPCHHLGEKGCKFDLDDRPLNCLLYPLRLNKNNTLVWHVHGLLPHGACRPCYKSGPPVFEALKDHLTSLFGKEQVDKAAKEITRGHDTYFYPSDKILEDVRREHSWSEANKIPEPRSAFP